MKLAIGERYRNQLEEALHEQNAQVIWLPDNPDVDERLAGHADLSVFSGDSVVIASNRAYSTIVNFLTCEAVILESARKQGPIYPMDAALCACSTGKYIICNPKTVDPAILEHANATLIPTNQGYTNCVVCVVSNDAIITADNAIASRAEQAGMDVLKIQPGYIKLDGFEYGFIGGASFLLNQNKLAFTGMLSGHPDKDDILAFLKKHNVEPAFLTQTPIFDIGGAVALP